MGFAEAVIAFVVIGIPTIAVFGLVTRVFRHQERKLELQAQIAAAQAQAGRQESHNAQLEQRVRVLERILTDKGTSVADEIEQLRQPIA